MKTLISIICPDCGKERSMTLGDFNRGRRKTRQCLSCYNKFNDKARRGTSLPNGEIIHDGYVLIYSPGHPRATNKVYVKRAILVMEKYLGRNLTHAENVHHINGQKDDDRIENLIILTNSEHGKIHGKERNLNKPAIRTRAPRHRSSLVGQMRQ